MNTKLFFHLSSLLLIGIFVFSGLEMNAQDAPQWRGKDRTGVLNTTDLNLNWSETKPPLTWTFKQAGAGYSSPAIVGTTLYCQGAADGEDFVFALDTENGNLKWKQALGKEYLQDRGNGPRGTITIDGNKLYLIRGGGQIHCVSAADGKTLWQKDFRTDFGGNIMSRQDWGFSESPLIDGNLVICTPGGDDGAIVALDKNTGNTVWRSKGWDDLGGYSSIIVTEIDGVKQYIGYTRKGVAGVDAKTGTILWSAEVAGNQTAVIPTPICQGNIVYVTSGYRSGCAALKVTKAGNGFNAEVLYTNNDMSNHHGGVVLVDNHIYGYSDGAGWVCQDLQTGETLWKERIKDSGKGAVICVNNLLICLDERTGSMTVAAASAEGWKEFGRIEIPERAVEESSMDNMVWTHPVVANEKLYLRDHTFLFCFDLKK